MHEARTLSDLGMLITGISLLIILGCTLVEAAGEDKFFLLLLLPWLGLVLAFIGLCMNN